MADGRWLKVLVSIHGPQFRQHEVDDSRQHGRGSSAQGYGMRQHGTRRKVPGIRFEAGFTLPPETIKRHPITRRYVAGPATRLAWLVLPTQPARRIVLFERSSFFPGLPLLRPRFQNEGKKEEQRDRGEEKKRKSVDSRRRSLT